MRTSHASIRTAVAVGTAAIAFTSVSAFGFTLFDNTGRQQPLYLPYARTTEYGDEYRLANTGPGVYLDSVAVQYYSNEQNGQVKLRVYVNDNTGLVVPGLPSPAPAAAPFLETDWKAVSLDGNGWGTIAISGITTSPELTGAGIWDRLTVTLEYQGLGVNQVIGWGLSTSEPDNTTTPEDIGWSPNDYWLKASPWDLFKGPSVSGQPYDFPAKPTAGPEGSTWLSIAGVAAMAGFGAYRRFRK
ncbi:MAG TPA: LPXTG cell wall anchor domain-containing protein [Lacipirellulaceae bacterium]|nr:LPXTG cell wall anchor domain-containing protein [Lacipirellulaceae bacterium]